jgi:hypothetical protein
VPHSATIRVDRGFFFVLEIAADAVNALLPPGIPAIQDPPGTALLAVNVLHFPPGGEGVDLPETYEIDVGVAVPVDNTRFADMPQAATAIHVLNIAATSDSYLTRCHDSGYRVHAAAGLRFDIDPGRSAGTVADSEGPILTFALDPPDLTALPFSRIGQDLVYDERGHYRLNFVFAGKALRTAEACPFALTLHDHPFFRSLTVGGLVCRSRLALHPEFGAKVAFYTENPPSP